MPGALKGNNARVIKTNMTLINSLVTLLEKQNFNNITVNNLCEEAMVGRATFYSHFADKYELARCLLARLTANIPETPFPDNEMSIIDNANKFLLAHKKEIKNIVEDANETILELLEEFFIHAAYKIAGKQYENDMLENTKYTVLLKFYAGGVINLLKWQIKNKFPAQPQFMNADLYNILKNIF